MSYAVRTKSVTVSPPDIKEIRRYANTPVGSDGLLLECLNELNGLTYRVCYAEFNIKKLDNSIDMEFAVTNSKDLQKMLKNCNKVLLFAATIGFSPDRLIAKYSRLSPAKALFIQAICTERIEALCNAFCGEMKEYYSSAGEKTTPRFSPGYGDLPLSLQTDIFKFLNCTKNLGISLNDSLIMSPSKSVTAIFGIETL